MVSSLVVVLIGGVIALLTRPDIDFALAYLLIGVASGLVLGSLVALLVWRKDRWD